MQDEDQGTDYTNEDGWEPIFVGITYPATMAMDEAIKIAKSLAPCATADFTLEQEVEPGSIVGNLECEPGTYDMYEDGWASPKDHPSGVRLEWETP